MACRPPRAIVIALSVSQSRAARPPRLHWLAVATFAVVVQAIARGTCAASQRVRHCLIALPSGRHPASVSCVTPPRGTRQLSPPVSLAGKRQAPPAGGEFREKQTRKNRFVTCPGPGPGQPC